MTTVTVHCPCGETWTYRRPSHYGGKAFLDKQCPRCKNYPQEFASSVQVR